MYINESHEYHSTIPHNSTFCCFCRAHNSTKSLLIPSYPILLPLPLYKYRGFAFVTFSLIPGTVVRYGGTCSLIFVEESPECKLVKCMMMGRMPRLRSTFGNLRHAFTFTTLRALRLDRVKVRGILRVEDLWNIVSWYSADHQPVNSMEERMVLDVIHTTIT